MADRPMLYDDASIERFWSLVDRRNGGGCWTWQGALNANGYGRFSAGGRTVMAHRAALVIAGRPAPDHLDVHHVCRSRSCVNPAHLQAVTHRENLLASPTLAAIASQKTHCVRGHPFSGDNLAIRSGKRRCKECDRTQHFEAYRASSNRKRQPHLAKAEVADIRSRIAHGQSHSTIAHALNLSTATISRVRNGGRDYGR